VNTDAAMRAARDNVRIAHARMRAATPREVRAVDRELDRSDAKLNEALGVALASNDFKGDELRVVNRIRAAFPAYLTVRERIVSAGGPREVDTEANRNRLREAFDRLQAAQEAFGAKHFASAGRDLQELRAGTRRRTSTLALALVFGLLPARRAAARAPRGRPRAGGRGLRRAGGRGRPFHAPARHAARRVGRAGE
jgi:hypothetical protein